MKYRIIYRKAEKQYYIQKLQKYTTWLGFGKDKERWVYVKKWYAGSDYPPYSSDTYEPFLCTTLEGTKEYLEELKEQDRKPEIEVHE